MKLLSIELLFLLSWKSWWLKWTFNWYRFNFFFPILQWGHTHISFSLSHFIHAYTTHPQLWQTFPWSWGTLKTKRPRTLPWCGGYALSFCLLFFRDDDGDPIIKFCERSRVSQPTAREETFSLYFRFLFDYPRTRHVITTLLLLPLGTSFFTSYAYNTC